MPDTTTPDRPKTNIGDWLLPAFAFVASAAGPYGAAGTQALLQAVRLQEQRQAGRREEQRLQDVYQLERPVKEAQAQSARDLLQARQGVQGILGAPALTEPGTAQLAGRVGQPLAAAATTPLARPTPQGPAPAIGLRPLPQGPPTPAQRMERLGTLAQTPGGQAQLALAGYGDVVKTLARDTTTARQLATDKREALGVVRDMRKGVIPAEKEAEIRRRIAQATSQEELTDVMAELGSGGKRGSISEEAYDYLVAQGLNPFEANRILTAPQRAPETPAEEQERQLRMQKLQADINKADREASGVLTAPEQRKLQLQVRGDIRQEPVYKDYQNAMSGYTAVAVGAGRGDAQGDLAILNGIVRLLDPGSVVRPSEFETARRAQGLIDQAKTLIPRLMAGETLSHDVRQRYLSLAEELIGEYGTTAKQEVQQVYGSVLQDTGVPLDSVFVQPRPIAPRGQASVGPVRAAPAPSAPAPAPQAPADPLGIR